MVIMKFGLGTVLLDLVTFHVPSQLGDDAKQTEATDQITPEYAQIG